MHFQQLLKQIFLKFRGRGGKFKYMWITSPWFWASPQMFWKVEINGFLTDLYYTTHTVHTLTHLQGKLVLNGRTEVDSLPDKGSKKYMFRVTCGHTGTPFLIYADDQRSKHEWILAIKRVRGY